MKSSPPPAISSPASQRRPWALLWSIALAVAVAALFWLTSRYPALDRKALVSLEAANLGLGFDPLIDATNYRSVFAKIGANAVNWLWANRQGMAFGIVLGAVILTLLSTLQRRTFGSRFANSAAGLVMGAPLGVCVNCAAPIGHAMKQGGARTETALGAMFSSPTYNLVVVSMAFSMLPGYIVVTKLVITLLFILFIMPVVASRFEGRGAFEEIELDEPKWFSRFTASTSDPAANPAPATGALRSLLWVGRTTVRNLWQIGRLAVPLMVVAALLGSAMITLLPFDRVVRIFDVENLALAFIGLVIISAFGLALPLPIAFDVVVAGSLWAAGFPAAFVMALFFSLGIYSVYSAFVVHAVFSQKLAIALAAPLIALSVMSGLGVQLFNNWSDSRDQQRVEEVVAELGRTESRGIALPGPSALLQSDLAANAVVFSDAAVTLDSPVGLGGRTTEIDVESHPLSTPQNQSGRYELVVGTEIGFGQVTRAHPSYDFIVPLDELGGGAAADINGDGWDDVVVTSDFGVLLYVNIGGEFQQQEIAGGAFRRGIASIAMLVDIDADGDNDLVASFWDGTTLIAANDAGVFPAAGVSELPAHPDPLAFGRAMAAADVDRDGDLDLAIGYWQKGPDVGAPALVFRQDDSGFDAEVLDGPNGQTLTMLFEDVTDDGWPDLIVGNDFAAHDVAYVNDGAGELVPSDDLLPFSGRTTMSFTTGDFDGDLGNELYTGQITSADSIDDVERVAFSNVCEVIDDEERRSTCEAEAAVAAAVTQANRERSLSSCLDSAGAAVEACLVASAIAQRELRDDDDCGYVDEFYPELAALCDMPALAVSPTGETLPTGGGSGALPSVRNRNLYFDLGEASPTDRAEELGLQYAGWTWDTSPADIDSDGDLDLVAVNGSTGLRTRVPNWIFLNEGSFVRESESLGFVDLNPTQGIIVLDVDNDGDLDILTTRAGRAPQLYRNGLDQGQAIELEFATSTNAVGATVLITAGQDQYRRDLTLSGGYLSFDALRIHVGLGDYIGEIQAEITWPTGEITDIGGLLAGSHYRIVDAE